MELDRATLLKLYETMVLIRTFEDRFTLEQSAGKPVSMGHSSAGQEAVPAGVCAQLTERDYVGSTHRGHGHCIAKNVEVKGMMAELWGKATGTCKGKGGSMHIADVERGMLGANGVVGSNLPIVAGAALSAKLRGTGGVAVAFFGDGASNQGTFHEALNLAAIWKLPAIFVCENNLYAESTPVEYAVAVPDIAARAAAYDIPGVVVDGQDVFAVYEATADAIRRAREGEGPSLLECKTYRYGGHYLADNHLRYRTQEEVDRYKARDCIVRFKERILPVGTITAADLEEVDRRCADLVDDAVRFAEESPYPDPSALLTDVYVRYP
jgi:pyruvate dehydrogenase E1 component alpha subunit